VEDSRSTEHQLVRFRDLFMSLDDAQRLAVIGALIVVGSLFLPWYGIRIGGGDLVKTGFGAFSVVEAALLITVGAALLLVYEVGRGRRLPAPLREGTLISACAVWAALLVFYRTIDRPELPLEGKERELGARYGVLIALAGAAIMFVAGARRRRHERELKLPRD
jgi:hypothetical protein